MSNALFFTSLKRYIGGDGGTSRSSRGLRVLSQKVKQIVQEKKQTSYKEVAEILTENFNTLMNSNLDISKVALLF